MSDPMSQPGQDVPDEVLQLTAELFSSWYGQDLDFTDEARTLLAAVLPAHEAMVRAAMADEIEGAFGPFQNDDTDPYAPDVVRYLRGLCLNCGRSPDDEPCGVLHMFRARGTS